MTKWIIVVLIGLFLVDVLFMYCAMVVAGKEDHMLEKYGIGCEKEIKKAETAGKTIEGTEMTKAVSDTEK